MTQPGDPQVYRVTMARAAVPFTDVKASTGDEAAALALAEFPGAFVGLVEPAPQKVKAARKIVSDEPMVEVDSLDPNAQPVAA